MIDFQQISIFKVQPTLCTFALLLLKQFGFIGRQIRVVSHSGRPITPIAVKGASVPCYFDVVYLVEI
ncbi:hypothetical protein KDH_26690 [Dictyobacter sp. S3.2.2.5]|uniref:Uncharacterized protein n=1 Tax=Dictyobacter halimunensis TaxID=3026934 RepID=A0ABQ6FR94_9CHLR|nr:hypothetical protein KDH_26690 [Dictyobacter sp. S3.2.2.5]